MAKKRQPKSRIFYHHETGRPIIRALNVPTADIPEYHLPYDAKANAPFLAAIVEMVLAMPPSRYQ